MESVGGHELGGTQRNEKERHSQAAKLGEMEEHGNMEEELSLPKVSGQYATEREEILPQKMSQRE